MALFQSEEERLRRSRLKLLEDKRLAFAQRMAKEGFAPERMLFAQMEDGGYLGLCRFKGQYCLVIAPPYVAAGEADFELERYDALQWRREEVYVKAEGMGGLFGFGKKAEIGVVYVITRLDGSEVRMPFVSGRSGWLEALQGKNPLLRTQRRRGDANVAWELRPMDSAEVRVAMAAAERYFTA